MLYSSFLLIYHPYPPSFYDLIFNLYIVYVHMYDYIHRRHLAAILAAIMPQTINHGSV